MLPYRFCFVLFNLYLRAIFNLTKGFLGHEFGGIYLERLNIHAEGLLSEFYGIIPLFPCFQKPLGYPHFFFFLCKGQLDKAKALDLADRANKYKNKCKQQQLQTSIR